MIFGFRKFVSIVLTGVLGIVLGSVRMRAEDHIVGTDDLHQAIVHSAGDRAENLQKVQKFFASEVVRTKLDSAGLDLKKIEVGLPQLSNDELQRLANQTEKIQADVSAGALNNQEITYIIIALATAVIILVIVAA